MAKLKKTKALFKLMEYFLTQKEISSYDERILDEFGCDKKTLERYLQEIESSYAHIVTIKKAQKKVWKFVRVSDIFEEFIKNSDDILGLFLMAQEFDPYIFKELEKGTLSKVAKNDENIFLFKNSIMEEMQEAKTQKIFKELKEAIKKHEYRDLLYVYNQEVVYEDIKPLKLMFMDNNWYLAFITQEKEFKFSRLSFIKQLKKRASQTGFQSKELKPYFDFLPKVQNAMTLYGVESKVARLKALPNIAKYFTKDMKKFLPSQTFQELLADGSVIFTVEYTQELEVLPFVQKWMPDLIIVEPKELDQHYVEKLNNYFKNIIN